jgi:hypothetical protein
VSEADTTHRGVRWHRDRDGNVSFYDQSTRQWVNWVPGVDAPPRPPGWTTLGVPTRVSRPGWRSQWRIIPVLLVLAVVIIAVVQAVSPSSNNTAKESAAAQALLGKCLAQHGTFQGHPRYSNTTVPCDSAQAAVKVVQVIPSTPGSPGCPAGTTGMELAYAGVAHPHIECVQPLHQPSP